MYTVYWLISESKDRTYVGYCHNLDIRLACHRAGKVRSTRNFGEFSYYILEKVGSSAEARKREKYWKSGAGRRKLKELFTALSSSG